MQRHRIYLSGMLLVVTACGDASDPVSARFAAAASLDRPVYFVDICHADDQGVVSRKSVPWHAAGPHVIHGDTYSVVPIPPGATFQASNTLDVAHLPGNAFDLDALTSWNSGSWPTQWIEVDFGAPQRFAIVEATADQTPNGTTSHTLSLDGTDVTSWVGDTQDKQTLVHAFSGFVTAQRVRLTTTASPSWVAWFEITFRQC